MPYRLVYLQHHLLAVEHDRRQRRGARFGAQERGCFLAHARRLPLERQPFDVLPARLSARPAVRAWIAPHLDATLGDGERVDAGAALEGHGALGGFPGAFFGEAAVAGEAPGPVDEHADPDAFCLAVGDGLDLAVLRRDMLHAPGDPARIRVTSARGERDVDCLSAQL